MLWFPYVLRMMISIRRFLCGDLGDLSWLGDGLLCETAKVGPFPDAPWCWNIYLDDWAISWVNVGKYSSTIEHMGLEWLDFPGTFLDTFCNICNDRPTMTGKTTSFSGSHWTEFNIFKFAILAGQTYRIMENHPLKLTRLILWNHPLHIYIIYIYIYNICI